jgi:hypothetical protein
MLCYACGKRMLPGANHHHMHPKCFQKTFQIAKPAEFIELSRLRSGLSASMDDSADSSRGAQFHGHYPKYSADLGGTSYILKFGKTLKYPLLPPGEFLSNLVGTLLGIRVAEPFGLIQYNGKDCFAVKSFLDKRKPQNLIHLWDIWPETGHQKDSFYLETMVEVLSEWLPYAEVKDCVEILLYDYLIGNGDRHRGNIGMIESGKGSKRLAPFFDNVTDLALESADFLDPKMKWHPGMRVELKSGKTDIGSLLNCVRDLGLGSVIARFQRRLAIHLPDAIQIVRGVPVNDALKRCFVDLLERRAEEITQWN